MNPEVQAAIITVAGNWTLVIAKTYQPKDQQQLAQNLIEIFRQSYIAITNELAETK